MIYIIGEKKPIMTCCIRCRMSYSETQESQDIYYKGLCPSCQHKEKTELMVNYRKRYSAKKFKELVSECPYEASNRRNRYYRKKKRK